MSVGVIAAHDVIGGAGTTYAAAVLARSPLAAWMLDETTGTVAADFSGNSRDATYIAGPSLGSTSLLTSGTGKSMATAESTNQCMSIASASWMNVSKIAVCCITNLTSATDVSSGDAIISRLTALDWLILRDTDGKWMASVWNNVGTRFNAKQSTVMSNSTTYHLGFIFDSSTLQLYVNGTSVASTAVSGTVATGSAPIEVARYSQANVTVPAGRFQGAAIFDGNTFTGTDMAALAAAA